MPGEISSECRARSNRNAGRHHRGFAGDFPRNPHSCPTNRERKLLVARKAACKDRPPCPAVLEIDPRSGPLVRVSRRDRPILTPETGSDPPQVRRNGGLRRGARTFDRKEDKDGRPCKTLVALSVRAATTFTSDRIQGVPVITQFDVDDLDPKKTQRFMFRGAGTSSPSLASSTDFPADACPYHGNEE
jgi:hypothetical protein